LEGLKNIRKYYSHDDDVVKELAPHRTSRDFTKQITPYMGTYEDRGEPIRTVPIFLFKERGAVIADEKTEQTNPAAPVAAGDKITSPPKQL
jgi:hypothetical protein